MNKRQKTMPRQVTEYRIIHQEIIKKTQEDKRRIAQQKWNRNEHPR